MKKIRIGRWIVRWQWLVIIVSGIIICSVMIGKCVSDGQGTAIDRDVDLNVEKLYGYDRSKYEVKESVVSNGQTLSHILEGYASAALIDNIARTAKPTFDFRQMRVGNKYALFLEPDSTRLLLRHFVYEKNNVDMVFVSVDRNGTTTVREEQKEQTLVRRKVTADIESSLWNCIVDHNLPPALAAELEDIYGWSVDFFSLQKGDEFTVVFDERYIEDKRVGTGTVWGAVFHHGGKDYYAVPFDQNGKLEYWDENGKSLRKQLLKAPLKYTRISSKFSNSRMHPILKIRRPHHGVDYAAPSGTPVVSIADGVVTAKYWDSKGGGNVLKIKHANNLSSSYLHLKGYAKGMAVGKRVAQGQLIAYVGTTGRSTGPHLDFRLYKGGTPIDPLKAPSNPVEPIASSKRRLFDNVKDKILAELTGAEIDDEERLTIYDLYPSRRKEETVSPDEAVRRRVKKNPVWQTISKIETLVDE